MNIHTPNHFKSFKTFNKMKRKTSIYIVNANCFFYLILRFPLNSFFSAVWKTKPFCLSNQDLRQLFFNRIRTYLDQNITNNCEPKKVRNWPYAIRETCFKASVFHCNVWKKKSIKSSHSNDTEIFVFHF